MTHRRQEVLWLIALEATLSFSIPVWLPASWNNPASVPLDFILALLAIAAACALIFHLAPAWFAARYTPLGSRTSWALVLLASGYTLYSTKLLLAAESQFLKLPPSRVTPIVLLLAVAALAFVRSWWQPAIALALLIGVALSAYMLTTPWHWISLLGIRGGSFSASFTVGLILAIAPAFAIGWRIGCLKLRSTHIWLTGLLGIFLPLFLSASTAAFMTKAGVIRYWKPSLYQDLTWALLGPNGGQKAPAWHVISVLLGLSLIGPALLGALSIRFLSSGFNRAKKRTLVMLSGAVVFWQLFTQSDLPFYPPYDLTLSRWAVFLGLLDVSLGLACLSFRPAERTQL